MAGEVHSRSGHVRAPDQFGLFLRVIKSEWHISRHELRALPREFGSRGLFLPMVQSTAGQQGASSGHSITTSCAVWTFSPSTIERPRKHWKSLT